MKLNQPRGKITNLPSNSLFCKRSQVPEIGVSHVRVPTVSRVGDYSPSMSDALIAVRSGACERLQLIQL